MGTQRKKAVQTIKYKTNDLMLSPIKLSITLNLLALSAPPQTVGVGGRCLPAAGQQHQRFKSEYRTGQDKDENVALNGP